jgi:CubicO group peptidase (beta-lactamase class C family)
MTCCINFCFSSKGVKNMTYQPRRLSVLCLSLVITALGAIDALGQSSPQPPAEIDRYVQKALVDWGVPGIAVAVVRGDTVLFAKGYGVRELGQSGRVDEHTVFDAASITKSFTATAAAILVDEGRLRWDDRVQQYLPELEFPEPYLTANMTLRDLLSHRVGLQAANFVWRFTGYDRAEVLRRVRFLHTVMPFRSGMVYWNTGYMIAGEAVSRAAKMPWGALIRQRLLEPLEMRDSFLWSERDSGPGARALNVAKSHIVSDGKQIPIDNRDGAAGRDGRNVTEAAGAVQSSVYDLTRWMILHLNNGVIEGRRLVSDSTMQEMHSPQVIVPTPASFRAARQLEFFATYGLGWQVWDYRGHPMLWHSGSGNGQIAYMALLPRDRLGVVVLINSWRAPILHGALASRIVDHYLGFAPRDYSAEALRGDSAALKRAAESWQKFLQTRDTVARAMRPATGYAGVYDDSLHGAITVRPAGGSAPLTLQMGRGEIADLERWNGDSLFVKWRNPVYRDNFPTLAIFSRDVAGTATGLMMRLNRDTVRAVRRR